jgi:hypothetical protein
VLDRLPVAIGLIDADGSIVGRAGQAAYVYRDVIPSNDKDQVSRWRVTNCSGALLHPSLWPSKRALRGEVDLNGVLGRYQHGDEQLFHVLAVPTFDPDSTVAAVSFIRRLNPPGRKSDDPQFSIEHRLVDALARAFAQNYRKL